VVAVSLGWDLNRLFLSLHRLGDSVEGRDRLYKYFIGNFDAFHAKFGKNAWMFGNTVQAIIQGFASFDKLNELKDFFKDKDTKEYQRPLQQSLESVHVRAKWVERDNENVRSWINSQ
jgi:aminopeptidase 2